MSMQLLPVQKRFSLPFGRKIVVAVTHRPSMLTQGGSGPTTCPDAVQDRKKRCVESKAGIPSLLAMQEQQKQGGENQGMKPEAREQSSQKGRSNGGEMTARQQPSSRCFQHAPAVVSTPVADWSQSGSNQPAVVASATRFWKTSLALGASKHVSSRLLLTL